MHAHRNIARLYNLLIKIDYLIHTYYGRITKNKVNK